MTSPLRKLAIRLALAVFGRRIASCREANRLCSEAHDRRLSAYERLSLAVHHRLCRDCSRYAGQLDVVCRCARSEREEPPLSPDTRKRLADALRAADARDDSGK